MASSCITTPVFQTFQQVIQVTLTKFTTTVTAQAAGVTVFTEVCEFGCLPGETKLVITETLPGHVATITVPIQAVVPSTVIRTSTQFITSCTLIPDSNPTNAPTSPKANVPGSASSTQPGVLQVLGSPTANPAPQGTGSAGSGGSSGLLGGGAQPTISSGFGQPSLTGSAGSAAGSAGSRSGSGAGVGAGSAGGSPGAGGISDDGSVGSGTVGGPLGTGTATVVAGSTSASHKGPIIGAVIAIVLIIATLAMLWYLIRRKRKSSTQPIREVQRRSIASSMESTTPQMGDALPGYASVRYDHLFPPDSKNGSMVHLDGTLYQDSGFWSDRNGSNWSLGLPAGMARVLPEYGS